MFIENMTSVCGHLILVTGVKYSSGTECLNPDKGMKWTEYIVSGRNILAVDDVEAGFHKVQSD